MANQIETIVTFNAKWWREGKKQIPKKLYPLLNEEAETHINKMQKQGYSEGGLYYKDDKYQINGWWKVTIITEEN